MQSNMQENHLTMHKTVPATVTIHFIDGTTQCFGFEAPEIDPLTSASIRQVPFKNANDRQGAASTTNRVEWGLLMPGLDSRSEALSRRLLRIHAWMKPSNARDDSR